MSSTSQQEQVVRYYSGWRVPKSFGIGRLSTAQTAAVFAVGAGAVIIEMAAGLVWAFFMVALCAALGAVSLIRDQHGTNFYDRRREMSAFRRARRRGANVYRSGPLGVDGRLGRAFRLPGILASAGLTEHTDALERPFALVSHQDGRVTLVMEVSPYGRNQTHQEHINSLVGLWGAWLAGLSRQLGVTDASVTVETSPDTGRRLRREMADDVSADSTPLAERIVMDVVDSTRESAVQVRTWVTVSFDTRQISQASTRRARHAQAVRELASKAPAITQTLAAHGGGAVHLARAEEVIRLARVAYDPRSEILFEEAAAQGLAVDLGWHEAGPVSHEAVRDAYHHDSATSKVWLMSQAPAGRVRDTVLERILEPSPDVERKRFTMLYRPMPASKAPGVVERDADQADNRLATSKRPSARLRREASQAQKATEEEASGAALVDFGAVLTVTSTQADSARALESTAAIVESMAASSHLLVRPAYGAQESAFALGLPLGVSPSRQSLVGRWAR
ncbi:SCO6880 family protein [Actinomyces sp. zg296]|uniref:SCO6880 family protein n=1 Tax=Actinomyces sp. zg296 TaxID=2609289 RepID=UPI0013579B11|nr:SCO6880 family protein [Actinomyces sp. zg296]